MILMILYLCVSTNVTLKVLYYKLKALYLKCNSSNRMSVKSEMYLK